MHGGVGERVSCDGLGSRRTRWGAVDVDGWGAVDKITA